MAWDGKKKHVTVQEILETCPNLGIPHFQRGLVWGNDSVSALLESLFLETPCGSFVFWKSGDNDRNGIPLIEGSGEPIEYLIVDGQQRIRSLYDVFHHVDADDVDNGAPGNFQSEGDTAPRVWCINLTRVPDAGHLFRPHGKEYALFVFTADPRKADSRSPLRTNVLPLVPLLEDSPVSLADYRECIRYRDPDAEEAFKRLFPSVLRRVRAIRTREFFVTVKEVQNQSEIVGLYNRINTGGKRVEAEEWAFSRLAAMDLGAWDQIRRMFELIHPVEGVDGKPSSESALRNQVLRRRKENLFGFKLFIRTFLQVCNYHFNQPIGTGGFSFSLVDRKSFTDRLRDAGPENAEKLWDITRGVVTSARRVLDRELCCDDLVFLPDTVSLIPVFQLLIQYPQLLREEMYRNLLAWTTILLLLAEPSTREVLHWTSRIQQESGAAFHHVPALLRELKGRVRTRLRKDNALDEASSIQNRYVLLLYWLLRRNGARDFSYRNVTSGKLLDRIGQEEALRKAVSPEKQHILPFSRLMRKLGEPDARRGSSHRFNNIGNLTYISRELNHYETGLGDRFIDLEFDSHDPDALMAHHLWDEDAGGSIQDLYARAVEALSDDHSSSKEQANKLYEEFCKRRRGLILDGLMKWLESLESGTLEALGVEDLQGLEELSRDESRLEAATPIFVPDKELRPDQWVRLLDYENPAEDLLVTFVRSLPRKCITPAADHALEVRLTDRKHVWLRLDKERVSLCFHGRMEDRLQEEILAALDMEGGEDEVYLAGSGQIGRLRNLDAAREKSHALKEEIEKNISKKREPSVREAELSFPEKWEKKNGAWAVDALHTFTARLEAMEAPRCRAIRNRKQKPFFALRVGERDFYALRPRSNQPTLCEYFRQADMKDPRNLEATKLFKQRLLDSGLATTYGKHASIEIPIAGALARFEELSGYLKDLAADLSVPSGRKVPGAAASRNWARDSFFTRLRLEFGDTELVNRAQRVYEFMLSHGNIQFGRGSGTGSLTFKLDHPLAKSSRISVLTLGTDGSIRFRFGNVYSRLGKHAAELLFDAMSDLPVSKGWRKGEVLETYGPVVSLREILSDEESLEVLKGGILRFISELENMDETVPLPTRH